VSSTNTGTLGKKCAKVAIKNKSALIILLIFSQILTFHWSKTKIESGGKLALWKMFFFPMHVGHNYWHP